VSFVVDIAESGTGTAGPGPEPNPFSNCMNQIHVECLLPLASQYTGMSPGAVLEQIANTDLRETCGLVDAVSVLCETLQWPFCRAYHDCSGLLYAGWHSGANAVVVICHVVAIQVNYHRNCCRALYIKVSRSAGSCHFSVYCCCQVAV